MSDRCVTYIDGYNFYYAIKRHPTATPICLGWCDFAVWARQFMVPRGGTLESIKYFTAPVGRFGAPGGSASSEAGRQEVWLRAVRAIDRIEVVEGYHAGDVSNPRERKEKETDVNIAVSIIVDAARDRFDRAILLTGDRDQRPTVRTISGEFHKRVDVWICPNQEVGFWKAAEGYEGVRVRAITPEMLRKSRLPESVTVNGQVVEARRIWRCP